MIFHIDRYEIHTDSRELLHSGNPQKIEPQVFKLLCFMLENPDRVISREELMLEVWKPRIISDSALCAAISAARHAIGDSGRKQKCIKTVSGSGYRFIAEFSCKKRHQVSNNNQLTPLLETQQINIKPISPAGLAKSSCCKKQIKPLVLPDKPSVAIMDFINVGSNEEGQLITYGLTSEINSALARLPHLFVIARASVSKVTKYDLQPKEVSQCLGVRYLVYGNIVVLSKRLQVTVSIVDAIQNTEIWSEHYNRPLDDIFQIQDDITQAAVAAIDSTIQQTEIERSFLISPESLSAWENYHRGLWYINRTTINDTKTAQKFFKKAISQDSRFARAYAGLSWIYSNKVLLDVNSLPNDRAKAYEYAQYSIDYDKNETMGYASKGRVLWLLQEYKQSIQVFEHGVKINPNHSTCYQLAGIVAAHAGKDTKAQQLFDKAQRLSPCETVQFSVRSAHAISLVHQKKYDEAVSWSLKAVDDPNAYYATYAINSACLELAGHSKQAKQYAKQTLQLKPDYSVEKYKNLTPHADKPTRKQLTKAMLSAGIPLVSAA